MHAESSSSPNVNQVILESLQQRGRGRTEYELRFSDGASFFVPTELAQNLGLSEGESFTEHEREVLRRNAEHLAAYAKGMELAARSEHCCFRLRRKLEQRGFSPESAAGAVKRLSEAGVVNDRRYAELWAADRLRRRPAAPAYICAELRKRGVARPDAEAALKQLAAHSPELIEGACRRAVEKLGANYPQTEKLVAALQARGFAYGEIRSFVGD